MLAILCNMLNILKNTGSGGHLDALVSAVYPLPQLRPKLVGIVAQGAQRKVLMMGGPLGFIIKRGDCVGKEKAVVKDIGAGYITFLVDPDPTNLGQRGPEEYSVQLNPKQLTAADLEPPVPARTATPPAVPPSAPSPGAGSPDELTMYFGSTLRRATRLRRVP